MTLIKLQAVLMMPLIGPQRIEMGHLRIRERVGTPRDVVLYATGASAQTPVQGDRHGVRFK
jgi:hypothetical protein